MNNSNDPVPSKQPTSSPQQTRPSDQRFWCMHGLVEDRHFRDLARWVADGVLMPLVDDEKGDIIGYMHCDQADWLCNLLNRSQQKAGKTSH